MGPFVDKTDLSSKDSCSSIAIDGISKNLGLRIT